MFSTGQKVCIADTSELNDKGQKLRNKIGTVTSVWINENGENEYRIRLSSKLLVWVAEKCLKARGW